jgi:predicted polyphosphate/ATP-dependent NAD kinase
MIEPGMTTASDTRAAAKEMQDLRVDLLFFAGGDGTARDISETVGESVPVLGIPAGVKMHSGVFAINPRVAGQLALSFLRGMTQLKSVEVVDFARELPDGNRELKLYGYMNVPYEHTAIQGMKTAGPAEDTEEEIAYDVIDEVINHTDDFIIIGPGKTAKSALVALGLDYTLLGVDVLHRKHILFKDADEKQLLELTSKGKSRIVVSVIGGQGFLFGRGNQQISPEVIRRVGKAGIVIVSTESKIIALGGRPVLVDTGDEELDRELSGYYKIVTGYGKRLAYRVAAGRLGEY